MTDHELDKRMDERLSAAGERWRTANPESTDTAVAERAASTDIAAPPRRRSRIAVVASAAVVAAALVAGAVVTLSQLGDSDDTATGGKTDLVGTVWRLDDGKTKSGATLYIGKDGRLVADDECTVVGAKVNARGTKIRATDVQIRHRDCTDQYGPRLGDDFAKVLATKPGYTAKQTTLTVGDLHFTAAPELPEPTIDVPAWTEAYWRLVRIKDASGKTVQFSKEVDLRVHNEVMTTSDGCNKIVGKVGDHTGPVHGRGSTLIACDGQRVIGPVLSSKFRASVNGTQLTIGKAGVGSLVYTWVPDNPSAIDASRLVGPIWRLGSVAGDPPAGRATLRFPTATTYVANDGCREFSGTATLRAGSAVLQGVPQSGAKGCAKKARGQATTIDSFLSAGQWSIRDGKLLIDGGGSQAFSLVYAGGASTDTPDPRLLGTWRLGRLVTSFGPASNFPHSGVTLTFDHAAGYRFHNACVDRSGQYVVDAQRSTVRFDQKRKADPKCTPDPTFGDIGQGLVYGMHGSNRYRIHDDRLVLSLRDGVTLTLVRS